MEPKRPTRWIKVRASAVEAVVARSNRLHPSDWQAECLALVCFLPNVKKRWQEVNEPEGHYDKLTFVDGFPYDAEAKAKAKEGTIEDWAVYAGYTLGSSRGVWCWNSVPDSPDRGYGHSPGTAWNGVRRETFHTFAEALRIAFHTVLEGAEVSEHHIGRLDFYRIKFENDLEPVGTVTQETHCRTWLKVPVYSRSLAGERAAERALTKAKVQHRHTCDTCRRADWEESAARQRLAKARLEAERAAKKREEPS